MEAHYSFEDEEKVRSTDVAGVEALGDLLDRVAQHPTDGMLGTVVLVRENGDNLSFSQSAHGHVFLVWGNKESNSWSPVGKDDYEDNELVPFEYFGSYSEAGVDQFAPRDAAMRAAEVFMNGGTVDETLTQLGKPYQQDS